MLTNERPPRQVPEKLSEAVGRIARLVLAERERAIQDAETRDLSEAMLTYLAKIAELHNPTMGELAEALGVSKPSATAAVERLNSGGYVQKVRSDADRRVSHLHLLAPGANMAHSYAGIHTRIAHEFAERLSEDETNVLIGLLEKAAVGKAEA